jgi:hypothetical protein
MRLDLKDVARLRAAGLAVVEIPGWETRGRPGPHDPHGILCHHTGGTPDSRSYAEWMALVGRKDEDPPLNPPLAQLGLSRRGIVYVLAGGRANHAGRARLIRPWQTTTDGNADMIGIEAMNTGSEGWGDVQRRAYVTVCAVLCRRRGWDEQHVLGHKETSTTGKPDPGLLDMDDHRTEIRQALQEDDMPLTDADVKRIAEAVWAKPPWPGKPGLQGSSAGNNLGHASLDAETVRQIVTSMQATLTDLSARLRAVEGKVGQ